MTFPEILEAVNHLSDEQLTQLQHIMYIKQTDKIPNFTLFESLSDEQLWDVVHQPFNVFQNMRLHILTDKRQMGQGLTDVEQEEVTQLIQAYDRFVMIRSMAMVTLQKRGVDVMAELENPE